MSNLDFNAVPTVPQIIAVYKLAYRFGHWWVDMARQRVIGPIPPRATGGECIGFTTNGECIYADLTPEQQAERETEAAYYAAVKRVTPEEVAASLSNMSWSDINGALLAFDTDPNSWGGVEAYPNHETQSGTLAWAVSRDGTVAITARRRGSRKHPAVWWTATVRPGGAHTITSHEGAPAPGDRWCDDHGTEYPQRGEYTWRVLCNAIAALGGDPPELPLPAPRRFSPRGKREMARIA